jgi:glucoamylase
MAQRRAMNDGAELAEDLGDNSAGQFYRSQAKLIENELARHWDSSKKAIIPTLNNKDEFNGKKSGLDSAVILSVLHSHTEGSFSFSDDRILSTLHQLEDTFGKIYSINQKGFPALAVGRYPEDRYDGYSTEGQGNPWLLNFITV